MSSALKPVGAAGLVPSGSGVLDAMNNAMELVTNAVLPAAEAGLALTKEKLAKVDTDKAIADAAALAQLAVAGSMHQADAALSVAREHISQVNIHAGIMHAIQKSQDVAAVVGPAAEKAGEWAAEHPGLTAGAVVGGLGVAMVAAPALVSAPLLGAMGFGPGGVVAGSLAAGAQAGIGNVAAGSTFAFLQSAGAGGAALAAVNGAVQGAGLAAAGIAAVQAAGGDGGDDSSAHEESSLPGPKEDGLELRGKKPKARL